MNVDNYVVRLVLTSFFGTRIADVENEDGEMESCICIPIERNNLRKAPSGKISAYFFMNTSQSANRMGWTHYLKMKCHPTFVKKMQGLGWVIPFAGNAKKENFVMHRDSYNKNFVKYKGDE